MQKMNDGTKELFKNLLGGLKPPPDLTISTWADRYRVLSPEASSEPGRWKTSKAPYQREIMDAICDTHIKKVVVMAGAQTGKTDAFILNPIGYYMDYDPAPIMVLQPTLEMAKTFSKKRLSTMLRDTPALQGKVSERKQDGDATILEKSFPGGYIVMVGANSTAALASRPIRILLADEIDRYPGAIGNEGDPVILAEKRLTTFWNRKTVCVSTPTTKGLSRIEMEYENSTQEEWNVPCPHCGEFTPLVWANIIFDSVDDVTNLGEIFGSCPHCGAISDEIEWKEQGAKGKFIAKNPGHSVRGFHLNSLASGFVEWKTVVEKFIEANNEKKKGNIEPLKSWTNLELAELWEDEGTEIEADVLYTRRESYGCEAPEGVILLTVAIDTQDDRFELEVVGWGLGKESWGIKYMVIRGDLKQQRIWDELSDQLERTYTTADGRVLGIRSGCMDSGGHFTTEVYKFCKERLNKGLYAIKGEGGNKPLYKPPSKNNIVKTPLIIIGVDAGKTLVYGRLALTERGAGYCHFPLEEDRGYTLDFFKGLTAEKKVQRYEKGRKKEVWEVKRGYIRNEPLDIRNYNTVAMELVSYLLVDPTESTTEQPKRKGRGNRSKGIKGG